MNVLDLFDTVYERALLEGAVDDLEARYIHGLNTKMLDLMNRARESQYKKNPEALAGLKREYEKIKNERDSFYKIREAKIGQDVVDRSEKMKALTPSKPGVAGAVKDVAKGLKNFLQGKPETGPTYEAQKKNSEKVEEYLSMGSDKNYQEAEPYKNYKIYVRRKPFGTTGIYTAHTEIDRKEFMGKGRSQEEAVQAIRDRIDFVLNAQKKVTGSSTIDFNVKFATDLLADPRQTFYAKLENINGEPKLIIAGTDIASDPELLAAGDFKRSSLRNQVDDEGRATPLPGIPLTAKGLRSGDWIANGRYTIGRETTDRDGNRVFDLTYHSTAHTKSDKLRLNQPAFTLGTAREVDEHGGGIGPSQRWQDLMPEQLNPEDDDWYDDDEDDRLKSGDYVRDRQDGEYGEIFRMSGDPSERRVRILDRDGKGWYISPDRLEPVDPTDPDIQRYFGKRRQRDMDEGQFSIADDPQAHTKILFLKTINGNEYRLVKQGNVYKIYVNRSRKNKQEFPSFDLAKKELQNLLLKAVHTDEQGVEEGWSDAIVARRTGRPRTPYSVYIKGRKWKDFANDDHAEAVANKLKAKFRADGRDPETITIAPTDIPELDEDLKKSARAAALAACIAAGGTLSGCATNPSVGSAIGTVRDVGTAAKTASTMTRAGVQDELSQELRNFIRAQGGDPGSQNLSLLYKLQKRLQGKKDAPQNINEIKDTEAVEQAILKRIMVAHRPMLMKYGPEKIMTAASDVAYDVGDIGEMGTSDISGWVRQVQHILGDLP